LVSVSGSLGQQRGAQQRQGGILGAGNGSPRPMSGDAAFDQQLIHAGFHSSGVRVCIDSACSLAISKRALRIVDALLALDAIQALEFAADDEASKWWPSPSTPDMLAGMPAAIQDLDFFGVQHDQFRSL
jgi:hypothetical protein